MEFLSVSPSLHDRISLSTILTGWTTYAAETLSTAKHLLQNEALKIVVCERDLAPYTWRDLLAELAWIPRLPLLVLTSADVDDFFWSEALNLGAYDVLEKPFEPAEVTRTLNMAWLHWKYHNAPIKPKVRSAAGTG